MKRNAYWRHVCFCLAGVLGSMALALVSGCATNDEAELTRLLQELDAAPMQASQVQRPAPIDAVSQPATASVKAKPAPVPAPAAAASRADAVEESIAAAQPPSVGSSQSPARPGSGQGLTIQPDCVVQVSVSEDPSLNGSYPVNDIGAVDIGYVGPVILYNKTEKEAAEKIREVLLNREFLSATVKVRILKASYGKVKLTGSVRQPGMIKVGAGDTISLNDALLRVGGLAPSAWGGMVRVYRGGLLSAVPEAGPYDDFALVNESGQPCVPDVQLGNNDVANVMPPSVGGGTETAQPLGDKEILVLGEVAKPGFYRFEGSEPCTMLHLMFRLGELPKFANTKAIRVVRRGEDGLETDLTVDVDRILDEGRPEDDVPLENGDRVLVPEKKFSFL